MEDIGESIIPIASDTDFSVDDVVLAFHGHLLYEAQVLSVRYKDDEEDRGVESYTVHYQGWSKSWEDSVLRNMVFEHNDENLRVAHRLLHRAKLRQLALQPATESTNHTIDNSKNSILNSSIRDHQQQKVILKEEQQHQKNIDDSIPDIPSSGLTEHLFHLPASLQRHLVDDWEYITKEYRLVSLPRKPTVIDILGEWVNGRNGSKNIDKVSKEVSDALVEYFDATLSKTLLYRFERKQYNDYIKEHSTPDPLPPSSVYGAEHLLRLIHKLPFMLECSSVGRDTMQTVAEKVNDLTKYMQKNGRIMFLLEYPTAPRSYTDHCVP